MRVAVVTGVPPPLVVSHAEDDVRFLRGSCMEHLEYRRRKKDERKRRNPAPSVPTAGQVSGAVIHGHSVVRIGKIPVCGKTGVRERATRLATVRMIPACNNGQANGL